MNYRKILAYTLFFVFTGLVVAMSVWHFWITFWTLVCILNALLGIIGASVMFSKFFKRKLDWETAGIWAACLFFGIVVFAIAWNYKPKYVTI